MAEFHFVEDYIKLVDRLVAEHSIDEAMAIAVGGSYDRIGQVEVDLLRYAGLRDGMALLDLGCGSGRLASALAATGIQIDYTGTDVVPKLLEYAAQRSPSHYRFLNNPAISIPVKTDSLNMVCAFSVFTHLLHHESYMYLEDARRALRSDGIFVFSFLEFAEASHWQLFTGTVDHARGETLPHLNSFIERGAIETWAEHLKFDVVGYVEPSVSAGSAGHLGQSTVILKRR